MLRVEFDLLGASPVGLRNGALNRPGAYICVQNRLPAHIARGPADGLNQRPFRPQEPFLIGVENRDQRHLRHVQALAQQVDTDDDVELAQPQIADDLGALDGFDV